ncbi:MAG: response regulator [Opitutales bacterium]
MATEGDSPGRNMELAEFSEILFGTLSHELRTPLNGVLGMVQLMRGEMEDNEKLETLEGSAWHMQAVLMALVNFSKIQSNWGNLPQNTEWLSVYSTMNQFAKNLKGRAGARHLKIEVIHQNRNLRLRGDLDHLGNIVESAILGSLESSKPPADRLTRTLKLSWSNEGPQTKVVIENPLEVWSEERDERITDVSRMLGHSPRRTIRMEFLYWAVSSALLKHYNGEMVSRPKEGGEGVVTTLSFTMESMIASDSTQKPVGGLSLAEAKKESSVIDELPFKKRVLIVEDDPVSQKILGFLLKRFGQETVSVENGKEAVELLAEDHDFALIFMDIDMPVLDGISATKAIRKGDGGDSAKEIPIAAVTAFNTLSDQGKFKKAGMNFTLSKPVAKTDLRNVLFEIERIENSKLPTIG